MVLGGLPGTSCSEYTMELKPGDRLFVYTDGVTEAANSQLELYGTGRMAVVCGMYSNTTALIDDYPDIARTFSGGTADDEQTDENQALDPYASQSNAELLKEISDNYSKTFGNSGFFSGSSVASFISSGITMERSSETTIHFPSERR